MFQIYPESTLKKVILLIITLIITILSIYAKEYQLLVIPIYFFIWMIYPRSINKETFITRHLKINYLILGVIFGIIAETFAILNNMDLPPEERALFHPDPLIDLILGLSYYTPLFFFSMIIVFRYKLNEKIMFMIGGIYGVLTEQTFQIFLSFNIILWIYVFFVYGSFIAIPYTILKTPINKLDLSEKNKFLSSSLLLILLLCGFGFAFILMRIFWLILGLPIE